MKTRENGTGGHLEIGKNKDAKIDARAGSRTVVEIGAVSGCGLEILSDPKKLIKSFIDAQVVRRGLDWRTGEAYRIDLERFYKWLAAGDGQSIRERAGTEQSRSGGLALDGLRWQEKMEDYLEYLTLEKRLRPATVARKYRVFNYYLAFLVRQGFLLDRGPLKLRRMAGRPQRRGQEADPGGPEALDGSDVQDGRDAPGVPDAADGHAGSRMSKRDVDTFFLALEREYNGLDSDFRKRICLRDLVMMSLLFYHGIEISELLRLEVSDYDKKTGVLTIQRKRGRTAGIYLYSRTLKERMETWIAAHGCFEREPEYQKMMFLSKLGRPLSMKMVINIFEKYRVMAGIEKAVTPKDLKRCMGEYARELMREWCE